jgi:solute carrier family 25 (mitochondrial thiamine pyrophosphate transporter), member 19
LLTNQGFWRGNVPAELLYVTYGAAQFSTYRLLSQAFKETPLPGAVSTFASGALAGATATTITYPLDLLRTRFAAQGSSEVYRSFTGSVAQIARGEGSRGFFKGLPAAIVQIVPYMGLFFAVYEGLRPPMARLELPFGSGDAAAGMVASTVAKSGVFPLDLIRKRLQVQGPVRSYIAGGSMPEYSKGVWVTGQAILASEGWRGLYKGLGISLIKAAPASAITMWSYERALKELKHWELLA